MNEMQPQGPFPSIYEMLQARLGMSQYGAQGGVGHMPGRMPAQRRQMAPQPPPQAMRTYAPREQSADAGRSQSVWHPFRSRFQGDK